MVQLVTSLAGGLLLMMVLLHADGTERHPGFFAEIGDDLIRVEVARNLRWLSTDTLGMFVGVNPYCVVMSTGLIALPSPAIGGS
jgi:hypothetical protein